jgi:hypothetical protein
MRIETPSLLFARGTCRLVYGVIDSTILIPGIL